MNFKIIQLTLLLFLLPCIIPAAGFCGETNPRDIEAKQAAELIKEKKQDLVVVDVRTPGEFAQGHIAGSQNINFFGPRFDMDIMKLPKDKPVLLYCKTGRRSEAAAGLLKEAGHDDILNLKGGVDAWLKMGGKLEK